MEFTCVLDGPPAEEIYGHVPYVKDYHEAVALGLSFFRKPMNVGTEKCDLRCIDDDKKMLLSENVNFLIFGPDMCFLSLNMCTTYLIFTSEADAC